MAKNYDMTPVTWLRVAEFMHGGLEHFLGGELRIGGQRVICVQHLRGARDVLRMETYEDVTLEPLATASLGDAAGAQRRPVPWDWAMSTTRHSVIASGLKLDASVVERLYGIGQERFRQYVPIECPKLCLTPGGLLRPWTNDVCFSEAQARALLELLREAFWQEVSEYAAAYAVRRDGEKYAVAEMVEDFCDDTGTSEIHIHAIRREWQRRVKRTAHGSK